MPIINYTDLQSAVADWLDRTDLANVVTTFIDNAESALRRDPRVRILRNVTFTVDADVEELPAATKSIVALYHDGPTLFGSIDIVSPEQLGEENRRNAGATGTPRKAAFVQQQFPQPPFLRFAPAPDQAYNPLLVYWESITRLTQPTESNWLLDDHADIYLYASLVESAPYMREDSRVPVWRAELDRRLEELHSLTDRAQYSGSLVIRSRRNIP